MKKFGILFGLLSGIVPLGIGLTVLGFLWLTPFNEFGSPPLFFRIFGSFIALAFVIAGATPIMIGWLGPEQVQKLKEQISASGLRSRTHSSVSGSYQCQHCGAPLESGADVSPHGDVKCVHCGNWFNIHADNRS